MTRIVAGSARGRRLSVPTSGTRPTSDRVREALFSALDSELRGDDRAWGSVQVLDLFAGTGALGLEALSRGARRAVLVESARSAVAVLRQNVTQVACPGAEVLVRDVRQLAAPAAVTADLVFADPPYAWSAADVADLLKRLWLAGWVAPHAIVVVERPAKDQASPLPEPWPEPRTRTYGDTALWYGRAAGADATGSGPDA